MKITAAQARQLGLLPKVKRKKADPEDKSVKNALFLAMCKAHGLPEPEPEFHFALPERKWRFDWAWMPADNWNFRNRKVALEIHGGVFVQGHHSRGQSQIDDWEKLNLAQVAGWIVLQCSPQQVESGEIFPVIRRALGLESK